MLWFSTAPGSVNWSWLLYHADLLLEFLFLIVLAGLACAWLARRPRATRWLLLALAFQATGILISTMPGYGAMPNSMVKNVPRTFIGVLQPSSNADYFLRECLTTLLVTSLQGAAWGCLAYAAFSDRPRPPQDECEGATVAF